MKKNSKRFVAAFLASVMFFTDCVSGVAVTGISRNLRSEKW